MFAKVFNMIRRLVARSAILALKWTGYYDGFFNFWRGPLFEYAERHGLHVMPAHYYSPIPTMSGRRPDDGVVKFPLADAATLDAACARLAALRDRYGERFAAIADRRDAAPGRFRFGAAPYGAVEAEALYGLIRHGKPRRIVEIGCGHTTLLMNEALEDAKAEGHRCDYVCIEPFRPAYLDPAPPMVTRFIDQPLQDVPMEIFTALEAGDILFIDSTHVISYDSDVVTEYLKILPSLKSGVLVHIHDIFLPYDYPTRWLTELRFFWTEQYLLYALLTQSPRYELLLPLHQLHRERAEEVIALFPRSAEPALRPSALWMRVR